MIGRILILSLLSALACFPQSLGDLLDQAPPDVDQALRTAVTKFYQAHVEGKFRAADAFVAEDSKDVFFAMEKQRCRGFEIAKVKYSDLFTRARAVVSCDTDMVMMIGGRIPVKMPLVSQWKLLDGRWQWYVDPPGDKGVQTPFGVMKPGPDDAPRSPAPNPVTLENITGLVGIDQRQVRLEPSSAWSAKVTITNRMPGAVSLSLEAPEVKGLNLKLDRTGLGQGESAALTIQFDPKAGRVPAWVVVRLVVMPTNQVIPVRIEFAPLPSDPSGR